MFLRNLGLGFILFNLLLVLAIEARAEYRVYQYSVKYKNLYEVDIKPYLVTSTLDPVSYVSYNGGGTAVKVDLLKTWTCKGETSSFKPYCPSPYEQAKDANKL